jgi:hypothetical protein
MHLLLLLAATLRCPVLDTATVAGAIGELELAVLHAENGSNYSCVFTRSDYQLKVAVTALPGASDFARFAAAACQAARDTTPVKAIGNEALACSVGTGSHLEEKLVSRVRNQAFTLSLTTSDKAATPKTLRSTNLMLAEQVAGNLF